jgi:hypothetical protein
MRGTVHYEPGQAISGVISFDCCAHGACVTDEQGGTRHLCLAEIVRIDYDWACPETRRSLLQVGRRRG